MKIARISAYVQRETLNFTFARQAFIVYFYICTNAVMVAMTLQRYNRASHNSFCYNLLQRSKDIGNIVPFLHISLKL